MEAAETAKPKRRRGLPAAYRLAEEKKQLAAQRERDRRGEALEQLSLFGPDVTWVEPDPGPGKRRSVSFPRVRVWLDSGTERIECPVKNSADCLEALIDALHGDLVVVGDHSAIARLDQGYIEALVMGLHAPVRAGRTHPYVESVGTKPITASSDDGDMLVEMSPASNLFTALDVRMASSFQFPTANLDRPLITLKISGVRLESVADAERVLTGIATAWAFELDVTGYSGFRVAQRPPWPCREEDDRTPLEDRTAPSRDAPQLPDRSYEPEPLAFYWYARSMKGAPFVQSHAYYQVLEFHFARCARATQLADLGLKLDSYDDSTSRDAFLSSLLNTFASMPAPKDGAQLRATVERITTAAGLKAFILGDKTLRQHLEVVTDVPRVRVTRNTDASTLPALVAQHIYAVRNRVMHGKEGGSDGTQLLLLPGDPQFALMANEVPLIRYLAIQALRFSSTPWPTTVGDASTGSPA